MSMKLKSMLSGCMFIYAQICSMLDQLGIPIHQHGMWSGMSAD